MRSGRPARRLKCAVGEAPGAQFPVVAGAEHGARWGVELQRADPALVSLGRCGRSVQDAALVTPGSDAAIDARAENHARLRAGAHRQHAVPLCLSGLHGLEPVSFEAPRPHRAVHARAQQLRSRGRHAGPWLPELQCKGRASVRPRGGHQRLQAAGLHPPGLDGAVVPGAQQRLGLAFDQQAPDTIWVRIVRRGQGPELVLLQLPAPHAAVVSPAGCEARATVQLQATYPTGVSPGRDLRLAQGSHLQVPGSHGAVHAGTQHHAGARIELQGQEAWPGSALAGAQGQLTHAGLLQAPDCDTAVQACGQSQPRGRIELHRQHRVVPRHGALCQRLQHRPLLEAPSSDGAVATRSEHRLGGCVQAEREDSATVRLTGRRQRLQNALPEAPRADCAVHPCTQHKARSRIALQA
mmetsp:Transcript_104460/g.336869  ORF Transcript_104460/g.336869 Transcript_104460/m.336869 type:complete len:410 (-) Transcript_104460:1238-2467(-)